MVAEVRNRFLQLVWTLLSSAALLLIPAKASFADEARVAVGKELLLVDASALTSSRAFSAATLPSEVRVESRQGKMMVASNPALTSMSAALAQCKTIMISNPGVICEPNVEFKVAAAPNDSYWGYQWNLKNIGAVQAWDNTTGSSSVLVAVVDTGVDYWHTDLTSNIAVNQAEIAGNGIDDDANGYVDDVYGYDFIDADPTPLDLHGHGTHVAGIIAARGNDGYGVSGVAWKAGILPVRVLDEEGSGTLAGVIAGIRYAVARGASVINLSLGAPYGSKLLLQALQGAELAGAVIVVAAGNESSDNDDIPSFPASYQLSSLISVAATDKDDGLASFSNVGIRTVHIAAPGVSILSLSPLEGYAFMSGTSMAAPHVAGVAALIKAINPAFSGVAIKEIILSSARQLPGLAGKIATGGRLNSAGAVALARSGLAPGDEVSEGQERFAIDLLQKAQRNGRRVNFSASAYSLKTGLPAVNQTLSLICGKRVLGATLTDSMGAARFSNITKAKRSVTCYAAIEDEGGEAVSNPLTMRKLQVGKYR